MYLASLVEMNYTNDTILQRIFDYHRINVSVWLQSIRKMNTWANTLDILLTAYLLRINITTVGNYMNGFICRNMQIILNNILHSNDYLISDSGTIYTYFHIFLDPLKRMADGNHFAYMQPIPYIGDQNTTNIQDGQLHTVTFLERNSNHSIIPIDQNIIDKQHRQLHNIISLDDSSESTRYTESNTNKNKSNMQVNDEIPSLTVEDHNIEDFASNIEQGKGGNQEQEWEHEEGCHCEFECGKEQVCNQEQKKEQKQKLVLEKKIEPELKKEEIQ